MRSGAPAPASCASGRVHGATHPDPSAVHPRGPHRGRGRSPPPDTPRAPAPWASVLLRASAPPARGMQRAPHQRHRPRARRRRRPFEVYRPSHRRGPHAEAGRSRSPAYSSRSLRDMDPRRHPHPHPRPRLRGQVEELPLVLQCPGARSLARPSRRRHLCRWSRQPQRHRSLPRLGGRDALPRPPRPRRRRVPRRPRPSHPRLPRRPDRPRSRLAPRARVEHTLARLKDWRVLRDHRRRGRHLAASVAAIVVLHNLKLELWDSS
jgi:hypothetical protein